MGTIRGLEVCALRPLDLYESLSFERTNAVPETWGSLGSLSDFSEVILPVRRKLTQLADPCFSEETVLESVRYTLEEVRAAVYVLIVNGHVHVFAPLCNRDYQNKWGPLFAEGGQERYEQEKRNRNIRDVASENYLQDTRRWWCNAGVLCNLEEAWSPALLPEYLSAICLALRSRVAGRSVPWCEFLLNKRDHPLARDYRLGPMSLHRFPVSPPIEYEGIPVVSPYTSSSFLDVPCPVANDWNHGRSFPCAPFQTKTRLALFRGTATGPANIVDNQRLQLCAYRHPLLDARLVGWNLRDKVNPRTGAVEIVDPQEVDPLLVHPVSRDNFVPLEQQITYRVLVYVEGHSAASRMTPLLASGSLVLWIGTRNAEADRMWYFDQLQPFVHYIPVRPDLSDLGQILEWAMSQDPRVEEIATQGRRFYEDKLAPPHVLRRWSDIFERIMEPPIPVDPEEVCTPTLRRLLRSTKRSIA